MTEISSILYRTFWVGIVWPVHLLKASFGCMRCASCIFVMVVELTLATFLVVFEFRCYPPPPCGGDSYFKRGVH